MRWRRRGVGSRPPRAPLGGAFWVLWTASTVSFLGDGLFYGSVPLLAASLTRDPRLISAMDALTMLGWLLLGLVSGVLVDRWRRTAVMWRVDALRAAITAVFAGLVLTGQYTIALVLAVSFVLGLASPFFDNASASAVPEMVAAPALERANSWLQTSILLCANLIGPPLGAALFVLDKGVPVSIDAASFVAASALVYRLRQLGRAAEPGERRALRHELREGLAFLFRHRLLRSLCALLGVVNGITGGVIAVLVLYVLEVLHLHQVAFGWLVAVFAVGGILGAVVAPWASRALPLSVSVLGASTVFGLGILVLGLWPSLPIVVAAFVVTGVASTAWNVLTISVRQRIVPAGLLGRVTSAYRMVGFAAMPLGAVGAGFLADLTSLRTTYVVGGLLLLVATALAVPSIRSGVREFRAAAV